MDFKIKIKNINSLPSILKKLLYIELSDSMQCQLNLL